MASYRIELKRSAARDISRINPAHVSRVWRSIEALRDNPFPRQSLKLSGAERIYRLRAGVYRVIYEVNPEEETIIIHYVRHRREAYRRL